MAGTVRKGGDGEGSRSVWPVVPAWGPTRPSRSGGDE